MSSTLRATTSQPRSLLSIATLNIAKSRVRPAICSLVRIDQTCFGRSGGLAPTNLPLFQGTRFGAAGVGLSLSCMVILLVCENDQHGLNARTPSGVRLLTSNRRGGRKSWQQLMTQTCRDTKASCELSKIRLVRSRNPAILSGIVFMRVLGADNLH